MIPKEAIEAAIQAYMKETDSEPHHLEGWFEPAMSAALTAAFSAMSEPVAYATRNEHGEIVGTDITIEDARLNADLDGDTIIPLYAAPQPAQDLASENERLRAALTPSAETRTAYIGEFSFLRTSADEHGNERYERITVPWATVKDIMKAIREHAALERT